MFNPCGDGSAVPPVNWQREPNTRGSWSIISSCLITLGLCLWTALHLNIPAHPKDRQKWRKVGWLIMGLLAPEMVAYTAFMQRNTALRMTAEMKKAFGEVVEQHSDDLHGWYGRRWWRQIYPRKNGVAASKPDLELQQGPAADGKRRNKWTLTHSFYAVMGGFAFDTTRANPNFLPEGRSRLFVLPRGLVFMAKRDPELIPDISVEEIRDKSKGDSLAKGIVCVQALWFCLQCFIRLAQHQAISLLELNVFGHALCALIIYGLWWHKPLDIGMPSILEGEAEWEMCALMCLKSFDDREIFKNLTFRERITVRGKFLNPLSRNLVIRESYNPTVEWLVSFLRPRLSEKLSRLQVVLHIEFDWQPDSEGPNLLIDESTLNNLRGNNRNDGILSIFAGQSIFGFRCVKVSTLERSRDHASSFRLGLTDERGKLCYDLRAVDVRRLQLCSKGLDKYLTKKEFHMSYGVEIFPEPQLAYRLCNFLSMLADESDGVMFTAFTVAGLFYGGLHLLAWNTPLVSKAEEVLWRFSGIFLASSGIAIALVDLEYQLWKTATKNLGIEKQLKRSRVFHLFLSGASQLFWALLLLSFVGAYILARTFLVVECCLQLARLPPSAYKVPQWSQYFPHI